jgi:peroxiredoxin
MKQSIPLRNRTLKTLFPVIMIVGTISIVLLLIKTQVNHPEREATENTEVQVGSILPEFELTQLNGETISLAQFKNQFILLNFWATWCESCLNEMPSLVRLRNAYKNKGFEVIGIDLDDHPSTAVPAITKELKIDFPIFQDPEGKLSELFNIHAIPFTVVFDPSRKVVLIQAGEMDWDSTAIRIQLNQWLKL